MAELRLSRSEDGQEMRIPLLGNRRENAFRIHTINAEKNNINTPAIIFEINVRKIAIPHKPRFRDNAVSIPIKCRV